MCAYCSSPPRSRSRSSLVFNYLIRSQTPFPLFRSVHLLSVAKNTILDSISALVWARAMADEKSALQSAREWVVDHKLRTVGTLWLSAIVGSIAYNWSRPGMKTSVKLIHARLHAQALTLAALGGSALVEYYDHQSGSGSKVHQYAKQVFSSDSGSQKD